MMRKLVMVTCAVAALGLSVAAQDLNIADSAILEVTEIQVDQTTMNYVAELYMWSDDATINVVGVGITFDEVPNLVYDSAVVSQTADDEFTQVIPFFGNQITQSNDSNYFQFVALAFGDPNLPTNQRFLMATYYFTLSGGDAEPASFTLDTLTKQGTSGAEYVDVGGNSWIPQVNLPITVANPTDVPIDGTLPESFYLSQNYPNPFNPTTTIEFGLESTQNVKLTVYNVLGQAVRTLVNERRSAGNYSVEWLGDTDAGARASTGVYFYRLEAGDFIQTKKMMLVK